MANTGCKCGRCLSVVDCTEGFTTLAIALDIAMACDDSARARYLAIYGVAWEPMVTFTDRAGVTVATTAKTVR